MLCGRIILKRLESWQDMCFRERTGSYLSISRAYGEEDVNVLIHDAARPFLTGELIQKCIEALSGHDGVLPVLPMKDTVYYSDNGNTITSLIRRENVYAGQAPELFRLKPYIQANESLMPDDIMNINGSREPAVMAGMDIVMIPGDESNYKITTKSDYDRFEQRIMGEQV